MSTQAGDEGDTKQTRFASAEYACKKRQKPRGDANLRLTLP